MPTIISQQSPLIAIPVCEARAEDLPTAVGRAARFADVIEVRLDYLANGELERARALLPQLRAQSAKPFLYTLRPESQGGRSTLSATQRVNFWTSFAVPDDTDLIDIELDIVGQVFARTTDLSWTNVICSHHCFTGIPDDIEELYAAMLASPAGILKLAVTAHDASDTIVIFDLLQRARLLGRKFIGIAMGEAGNATRILGPAHGSFMTYAALDGESANAPGQVAALDLLNLYRFKSLTSASRVFAIIGDPVAQSMSPRIHTAGFAARGLDAVYLKLLVHDPDRFMIDMAHPRTRKLDWKLAGLSVTAPHKQAVIKHLDQVDAAAAAIGAVNTILVDDGGLAGFNTDVAGFMAPLTANFGSVSGLRCAILGAGGAARSAIWGLQRAGANVTVFARSSTKASQLARDFDVELAPLSDANLSTFDIVVNATPLGMAGKAVTESPVSAAQLAGVRLAYDMVYNPPGTRFLAQAVQAGCETIGGLEMLLGQAYEQHRIWIGAAPPKEAMDQAVAGFAKKAERSEGRL